MKSITSKVCLSTAICLLFFHQLCVHVGAKKNGGFRRLNVLSSSDNPSLGQRSLVGFGHYSEVPESCPAKTTCPLICVNDTSVCPTQCPEGQELCIDGSCSSEPCDETIAPTCFCDTAYASCPWITAYYDDCLVDYQEFYDEYDYCLEVQYDNLPRVSFTSFWFLLCYFWISTLTLLVAVWCAMNPTGYQSETLIPASYRGATDDVKQTGDLEWTQAGYRDHWLGSTIFVLVWITLIAIQVLLIILTVFYYMQQESITYWYPVFYDDVQVLLAFIIAWNVGFVWTFMFLWPTTIASIFRRRCSLNQATHVIVTAPVKAVSTIGAKEKTWWARLVDIVWWPVNAVLRRYFSAEPTIPGYESIWCKVDKNTLSFYCRMCRYVYSEHDAKFVPGSVEVGKTVGDFYQLRSGLSTSDAQHNSFIVGPNTIMLEKPSLLKCIWIEFSKPFYVYQTFIVWTWFNYWYYHVALIATIVRLIGGTMTASFQYMNDSILYQLTKVEGTAEVLRNDTRIEIPVIEIVPGDVIFLKPGVVSCDLVVLESEHLLVDESALTGESNPVYKSGFEPNSKAIEYDEEKHKQHTIFAGTTITKSGDKFNDVGVVLATGSSTKKGQLLGDILSYKRHNFLFDHEVPVVLLLLVFEMIFLVALVFYFLGEQPVFAWFYGMFVVATVIPPLLPTVFVISVGVSSSRLQKRKISCTQPQALLVAGKVNVCCFDKTGTLTESGMNTAGVDCGDNDELAQLMMQGMAVCHNLRMTADGNITGHEVDQAMFRTSGASIAYQKGLESEIIHLGKSYKVVKQFTFDHKSATQSVIVESDDGLKRVFVKGSPEAIRNKCLIDSIPTTFVDNLNNCSKAGMYVLAIATKELDMSPFKPIDAIGDYECRDVSTLSREEVESSLTFCGFLKFENRLKAETPSVMQHLRDANVLLTMITGDNVLTGIRIAREAGICVNPTIVLGEVSKAATVDWYNLDTNEVVDNPLNLEENVDIALTGEAWSTLFQYNNEMAMSIVDKVRVFGRCNPHDKVSVVTNISERGYVTLMCGDGQNDCGALRAAHIGIALSTSEASVVAPFTSLDKTVSSVTDVLLEGRCSLSSALKVYSYYILYGQLCSILQVMNSYFSSTFGDWAWIFLDAIWPISLALTLPLAKAAKRLSLHRPTASLFGVRTLSSICGLLFWNLVFLVIAMFLLFRQDWFLCRMWIWEDVSEVYDLGDNYETSVAYIVGGYQFVATAIALNYGYTWRAPWYTNHWFNFYALLWTVFQYVMTLYPSKFSCIWRVNCDNSNVVLGFASTILYPINNPYNTTVLPVEFRWTLVILMIFNQITLCAWEYFFVNGYLYRRYNFDKDLSLTNIPTEQTISFEKNFVEEPVESPISKTASEPSIQSPQ